MGERSTQGSSQGAGGWGQPQQQGGSQQPFGWGAVQQATQQPRAAMGGSLDLLKQLLGAATQQRAATGSMSATPWGGPQLLPQRVADGTMPVADAQAMHNDAQQRRFLTGGDRPLALRPPQAPQQATPTTGGLRLRNPFA